MAAGKPSGAEPPDLARAMELLRGIVRVVGDEARRNPRLAAEIAALLGPPPAAAAPAAPVRSKPPPAPRPAPARSAPPEAAPEPPPVKHNPPLLDPFEVYEQGWEALLRSRLDRLDTDQLADVIYAYGMDPAGRTGRKTPEELRDWIVEAVEHKTA